MSFDLKKYLTENRLTQTSRTPSIQVLKDIYFFDKLGELAALDGVDPKYRPTYLVFPAGYVIPDDTHYDDSEYQMILDSPRLRPHLDFQILTN